jgi:chromosome segregation ATPase
MSSLVPEVHITELEAELEAKDAEFQSIQDRLSKAKEQKQRLEGELQLSSTEYTQELKRRIADLEAQTEKLRPLESLQGGNERLKVELDHTLQLRQAFEAKFKETKVQLLQLQHSPLSLASLQQENLSLRLELQTFRQKGDSSQHILRLEKEIATLKTAYDRLYEETRQEAMAAADTEEEGRQGEVRRRGKTEAGERTPAGGSVGPTSYCPSFLRQKKVSTLPPKRPSSRFLRLDLQHETFEGVDS